MSWPTVRLRSLDIDTLQPERADVATGEVRQIFEAVERSASHFSLFRDADVDVIVTGDMAACVDRISAAYGRNLGRAYTPARKVVRAVGITLFAPIAPSLQCTIVLEQVLWVADGNNVSLRCHLVLHEIGHVLQQARMAGAERSAWNQASRTYLEEMTRAASVLWEEFDADLFADEASRNVLRTADGERVDVVPALLESMENGASTALAKCCEFVLKEVEGYRRGRRALDDLHLEAMSILGETLTLLAHAAAHAVSTGTRERLDEQLLARRGFREYLLAVWPHFCDALALRDRERAVTSMVDVMRQVLERMGIRIEDRESGTVYVHVSEPQQCC